MKTLFALLRAFLTVGPLSFLVSIFLVECGEPAAGYYPFCVGVWCIVGTMWTCIALVIR